VGLTGLAWLAGLQDEGVAHDEPAVHAYFVRAEVPVERPALAARAPAGDDGVDGEQARALLEVEALPLLVVRAREG
jgi:hypothetical protein